MSIRRVIVLALAVLAGAAALDLGAGAWSGASMSPTLIVAPPPVVEAAAPSAPAPTTLAAAYSAPLAAPATAPAAQTVQQPQGISVVGEGVVTVQPDVANLTMGVEVFNPSLAQAEAEASTRMNSVIDKLVSLGISKDDIQTVGFNVNPEYDYPQNGTPTLRGFRVSNVARVKIRNVSQAGAIVDAVIAVGATTVQGISFDVDNPQSAKDQARTQAMQNARHKAEQLAVGAGVGLGKVIYVQESDTGGVPPIPYAQPAAAAPARAEAAPPPIQPGSTEIRTLVNVTFAIQ